MSWFILDLISVIPFDLIFTGGDILVLVRLSKLHKLYKLVRITKLMRALRVSRSQNNIWAYLLELLRLNPAVLRIGGNTFGIIVFCHLGACLWYFVATTDSSTDTWVWRLGMQDSTQFELYLISLYWITQTVITVGYGDVPAFTVGERIIAIFAMFAGVIFFSLTVGTLTSLLSDIDKKNQDYESKVNVLMQIKEKYKVKDEVINRVRNTLKFGIFKGQEDFEELLETLPHELAIKLGMVIYEPLVENIYFFDDKPEELIRAVGPHLKSVVFAKGDKIYVKGEYSNEIYFIKEGSVSLVVPEYFNQVCMTVNKGGYFGEVELIHGTSRYFTFLANADCELLSLEKKHFMKIFFKDFRNIGLMIKEEAESKLVKQRNVYNTVCEIINTAEEERKKLDELSKHLKEILSSKHISKEAKFIRKSRARGSLKSASNLQTDSKLKTESKVNERAVKDSFIEVF